jgi:hypothetical protein
MPTRTGQAYQVTADSQATANPTTPQGDGLEHEGESSPSLSTSLTHEHGAGKMNSPTLEYPNMDGSDEEETSIVTATGNVAPENITIPPSEIGDGAPSDTPGEAFPVPEGWEEQNQIRSPGQISPVDKDRTSLLKGAGREWRVTLATTDTSEQRNISSAQAI